jgi:prepilin-type N-terminal cleavage/methylation domain-containing protein
MRARRGATLIELLCVLAIVAIVASVATLAIRTIPPADPTDPYVRISVARHLALVTGVSQEVDLSISDTLRAITIAPTGIVSADSLFHLDPLTGLRTDVAH